MEGKEAKDRKGLGKVFSNLSRMKTILKKPGETSSKRPRTRSTRSEPTDIGAASAEPSSSSPPTKTPHYEGATRVPRTQIQEERARKLAAGYGVEIKSSNWDQSEGDVYRVEKPVRVRIHRSCHRCHTAFGGGNQCPSCNHIRCSKCERTPPKRTESERRAHRERRDELARKQEQSAPIVPHYGFAEPIVVKRASKTGGQPLVHKPPRMRVRRNCHKCNTLFPTSNRVCERCGHRRCDDCTKSPNKKKKYPYGYPGDEPGVNSPSFYSCHECNEKFPPNTENGLECESCLHQKCDDCPRVPRVAVQPEPDPEILRGISGRFEQLNLS
ncbi:hypothetical protein BJ170DRAFT_230799 [Xylariales sp. AK1849]|nr:hypothetical protein BJ170DRAFT_230799 [Xylariales sp. AK1849]